MIKRLWYGWVELLSRKETGEAFAIFRILCGFGILFNIGSVVMADIVDLIWIDAAHGGYRSLYPSSWSVKYFGGPNPKVIWTLVSLSLASGVALIIGIGGRFTALVATQCVLATTMINGHAMGSYGALLGNGLWILVFGRSTATFSLDCRLRTGSWRSDEHIMAWPRYMAVFQLVALYFSTGIHKVSAYWTPAGGFSALYYIMQQPSWHRSDMLWLANVYPLTQIATATTWFWEVTWPIVLLAAYFRSTSREYPGFIRRQFNRIDLRLVYGGLGLCIHIGIFVFLEVGAFSWIALSFYPCLFKSEELKAFWHKIKERFKSKPTSQT